MESFSDSLSTILLFVLSFLALLVWFRRPRSENIPPGPRWWPIVGNLMNIGSIPPCKFFHSLSKEYNGVFSVWLGRQFTVVLNDFSSVKEAMVKQADIFSDRRPLGPVVATDGVNGSMIFESGPIWKERRRFGMAALRSFGMGKRSTENAINEEARYLLECFSERTDKPFNPTHVINNAVSNIISKISFGYRFEYSDPRFMNLLQLLRNRLGDVGVSSPVNTFPWLLHTPLYSDLLKGIRLQEEFIHDIVKEHRKTYDTNDLRDIIDMHLVEEDHWNSLTREGGPFPKGSFDDKALVQLINVLFGAGTDTTTNTLLWLLMFVTFRPDVQDKVYAEIEDVIGMNRQPLVADRKSMPYTNAAISEALRMRPVVPLAIPHETNDKTTLSGYTIPKNTVVLVNLWAVHNDPDVWPEPERYDPTRFLSDDGKTFVPKESLIPFGIGRRVCVGEGLARDELFLVFVNLLQQFSFTFPDGKQPGSIEGGPGLVLSPFTFEICPGRRN